LETDRRVAIITGGSRGIGAGLVAGYRRRGWAVAVSALESSPHITGEILHIDGGHSAAWRRFNP